jgi:hypothetical protein
VIPTSNFQKFREEILRYRKGTAPPLIISSDHRCSVEYVPFEHVNADARIVIVGITPGPSQRDQAYEQASRFLKQGVDDAEILKRVKSLAAFGGPTMRPNLERMLNVMGVCELLGIEIASHLWKHRADLLHATSVIPNAAFVRERPFAGSFAEIMRTPVLRQSFEADFLPSLDLLRGPAFFIGLGPTPAAALSYAANQGVVDESRVLGWLAHPSTSGGSQVDVYIGKKSLADLNRNDPVRHRTGDLVAAANEMRRRIAALKP